jgi:hypothetical protein
MCMCVFYCDLKQREKEREREIFLKIL